MSLLTLEHVNKTYGQGDLQVHALNGVDLTISKGEFTTVFGPSGSGKTTLLNLIGALDRPTSGSVVFLDKPIGSMNRHEQAAHRRFHVGFIFQSYNLIPVLTAYENVEFALKITGIRDSKKIHSQVTDMLDHVGLSELMHRRPNQLSGGQKQRVAVARALVKHPKLVLADEPTANLDSKTSKEVIEVMLRMNRELHTTFIFSTHDPMVMEYARRMVEIRDGNISQDTER